MKVYRIHISGWTASFRYPNMISGFQPTLPVPPLSTINGLISAAMGRYFIVPTERIAFTFFYRGKATDLETIYQMRRSLKGIKSNVIKREFLFDADLFLYTDSQAIADSFHSPKYQLLLGRSGDLAMVNGIRSMNPVPKPVLTDLKGTVVPFGAGRLPAPIQALPVAFSDTLPRQNLLTRPYYILAPDYRSPDLELTGFADNDGTREWDVYWQERVFPDG